MFKNSLNQQLNFLWALHITDQVIEECQQCLWIILCHEEFIVHLSLPPVSKTGLDWGTRELRSCPSQKMAII